MQTCILFKATNYIKIQNRKEDSHGRKSCNKYNFVRPIGHSSNQDVIIKAIDALYKIITENEASLKALELDYTSTKQSLGSVKSSSSLSSSIGSSKQALESRYQQDKQKLEKARDDAKEKLEKVKTAVRDSTTKYTRETLVTRTKQVFLGYNDNDKVVQQVQEKIQLFQDSIATIQKALEAQ